jgi:molybdenum cofactor synthesis domain-containing protein
VEYYKYPTFVELSNNHVMLERKIHAKEFTMTEPVTVEIFIIGNEILNGEIQDTNTHWLCREITGLGGRVVRGIALRDDLDVVPRNCVPRRAWYQIIFTSGGLGPTADDLTLAAVAKCVGTEMRLHEKARQMIKDSYDALLAKGILAQGGLTPAREKMAWLPQDAVPLYNPVGTAPCSMLHTGQSVIISLPGVPKELKGIFNSSRSRSRKPSGAARRHAHHNRLLQ